MGVSPSQAVVCTSSHAVALEGSPACRGIRFNKTKDSIKILLTRAEEEERSCYHYLIHHSEQLESENKRLAYVITCSLATALSLQREFANTVYILGKLKVSGLGSE